MSAAVFHYTDTSGFNGIRSSKAWRFRAQKPVSQHPIGAYFTDYDTNTPLLALKLRIPKMKVEYFFSFRDANDLKTLPGGRGRHIFYSSMDYVVAKPRQVDHGATGQ